MDYKTSKYLLLLILLCVLIASCQNVYFDPATKSVADADLMLANGNVDGAMSVYYLHAFRGDIHAQVKYSLGVMDSYARNVPVMKKTITRDTAALSLVYLLNGEKAEISEAKNKIKEIAEDPFYWQFRNIMADIYADIYTPGKQYIEKDMVKSINWRYLAAKATIELKSEDDRGIPEKLATTAFDPDVALTSKGINALRKLALLALVDSPSKKNLETLDKYISLIKSSGVKSNSQGILEARLKEEKYLISVHPKSPDFIFE